MGMPVGILGGLRRDAANPPYASLVGRKPASHGEGPTEPGGLHPSCNESRGITMHELILGGARSGKSRLAERLAAES